jgi:predicted nucleotidyltransferase
MKDFELTVSEKASIIKNIENALKNKVEAFFIIGSFLSKNWNPNLSDIDIICVDSSFSDYPYFVNLKYLQNNLSHLSHRFDIELYTWEQFDCAIRKNMCFTMKLKGE